MVKEPEFTERGVTPHGLLYENTEWGDYGEGTPRGCWVAEETFTVWGLPGDERRLVQVVIACIHGDRVSTLLDYNQWVDNLTRLYEEHVLKGGGDAKP